MQKKKQYQGLEPHEQAATVIGQIFKFNGDSAKLIEELTSDMQEKIQTVKSGDLSPVEEILVAQMCALNAMFLDSTMKLNGFLTSSAAVAYPQQTELLVNLVLRIQNQTLRTAKTIADIRHPKQTAFIKELVFTKPQQLEEANYAKVDLGSKEKTSSDSQKEANVEVQHRTQVNGRKGQK